MFQTNLNKQVVLGAAMPKSKGWPLRKVVEEFKSKDGQWRERLECGHVLKRSKFMEHYTPARRRCRECAGLENNEKPNEANGPATR